MRNGQVGNSYTFSSDTDWSLKQAIHAEVILHLQGLLIKEVLVGGGYTLISNKASSTSAGE